MLALLLRPETVLSPRVMKHGIDRNVWLKKPGIKNPMYTDTPSVTERSTGGGVGAQENCGRGGVC